MIFVDIVSRSYETRTVVDMKDKTLIIVIMVLTRKDTLIVASM